MNSKAKNGCPLKHPINLPCLGVKVHVQIAGCCGQSGDGLDVRRQCIPALVSITQIETRLNR